MDEEPLSVWLTQRPPQKLMVTEHSEKNTCLVGRWFAYLRRQITAEMSVSCEWWNPVCVVVARRSLIYFSHQFG
jgi:hypothetical protein